jgi:thioesterase domain-containing protein
MNLDDAQGRPADAIAEGRAGLKKVPSLALALAVAQRLAASGNREAATWMVRDAVDSMPASAETWEVEREAAVLLAACGRTGEAIGVYRKLFESDGLPAGALSSWMAEARQVALASGDTAQAAEWEEELTRNAQRRIGGARQPDGGP